MLKSEWDSRIMPLDHLIMKPYKFNDLKITLVDAVNAYHQSGWIAEEHRHPWFEFNYVSEGYFCTNMSGREFIAGKGSFFLIPPGSFHSHRNDEEHNDDGFCLRWQLESDKHGDIGQNEEAIADKIRGVLGKEHPLSFSGSFIEKFIADITEAKGLLTIQLAFAGLLVNLYELWNGESIETKSKNSRQEVLVHQVVMYLSEYYANPITVMALANIFNVSYRHLARIFKQVTGITIIEKLNDIRINVAKELLKNTTKTIREIATDVGFENEYYFSSTFSRYSFTTPSEFRKRVRA